MRDTVLFSDGPESPSVPIKWMKDNPMSQRLTGSFHPVDLDHESFYGWRLWTKQKDIRGDTLDDMFTGAGDSRFALQLYRTFERLSREVMAPRLPTRCWRKVLSFLLPLAQSPATK